MASKAAPPATKSRRATFYGVLGVLVFAGLLFFVLDCPVITMSIMGGPYKKAIAEVGACEAARELLGDDVRLRTFGASYGSSSGDRGAFRIPVAGSKQPGILDYRWSDELDWTLFVGGEFTRDGFSGTTLKSGDCEKAKDDGAADKAAKGGPGKDEPSSSTSSNAATSASSDDAKPEPTKDDPKPEPTKDDPSAEPPKVDPPKDAPTKDPPAKPVPTSKKKKPGK